MTWTAAIMSDDNLDPESVVGRMLRPTPKELPIESKLGDETLSLWRAMADAFAEDHGDWVDSTAAEIEALRDWLPDMPPKEFLQEWCNEVGCYDLAMVRYTMEWIRATLTKQASVARGKNE